MLSPQFLQIPATTGLTITLISPRLFFYWQRPYVSPAVLFDLEDNAVVVGDFDEVILIAVLENLFHFCTFLVVYLYNRLAISFIPVLGK